jgi:hypothetical protein
LDLVGHALHPCSLRAIYIRPCCSTSM